MALRIGFAGYGYIASVHTTNLKRDARVEIASFFDPDPARGGELATRDFDEMLGRVDAVYVTSPNTLHGDLALRAVELACGCYQSAAEKRRVVLA